MYINENKFKKALPPYVDFPSHKVSHHREFHFHLLNKAMQANSEMKMFGCWASFPEQ